MEFKQLQSFTALVQYKSFTKAAEVLNISQPTISTHIRLLEEELGSKLITRTTKSVEVTGRGWELYECANQILDLRDNLIARWAGDKKKVLHLGVSTLPSSYILPDILPEYGKIHPENYFVVHQGDSASIIEKMSEGEYDIGIVGSRTDDEELEFIPFYEDKIILITPVSDYYQAVKNGPDSADEKVKRLLAEPFILREQGSGTKKLATRFLEKLGIEEKDLRISTRINDQESVKNLVAGGMGISMISEKAAAGMIREKRLLGFELGEGTLTRPLYLVVRKGDLLKRSIGTFVNFVRHYYN